MIVNRAEKWQQFIDYLENYGTYNQALYQTWRDVVGYVENENLPMPAYSNYFDEYAANLFIECIDLTNWDTFSQRCFNFWAFIHKLKSKGSYWGSKTWHFEDKMNKTLMYDSSEKMLHFLFALSEKHQLDIDFWRIFCNHEHLIYTPVIQKYILDNAEQNLHKRQGEFIGNEYFLKILLKEKPTLVDTYFICFVGSNEDKYQQVSLLGSRNIAILLENNFDKFENRVLAISNKINNPEHFDTIFEYLLQYNKAKYEPQRLVFTYGFFHAFAKYVGRYKSNNFYYSIWVERYDKILIVKYLDILFELEEKSKALLFLQEELAYYNPLLMSDVQDILVKNLALDAVPFLLKCLGGNFEKYIQSKFQSALNHLANFDLSAADLEEIWKYTRHKDKTYRAIIARFLGKKLGDEAIPKAELLLQDKKADFRQTAALILASVNSEKAQAILVDTLEKEANDDARDVMLEGLSALLATQTERKSIIEKVKTAEARGKLSDAIPTWMPMPEMPNLYWLEDGEKIDNQTVSYLFYRMSRSKDIRFDAEAKPLFAAIDKTRSGDFATHILKEFLKNSADAKLKYFLTIAAVLGDDKIIPILQKQVTDWVENSRGKMAEYAVKAIAMNGSNKAMRAVEFYSRKYKSKQKNIGAAAEEAFKIAAEELGLAPYNLADSIVPDFGFVGLFKEFEANNASYRAFVDNNFKIAVLDEDNKLLKKMPKGTAAALEEEFKEIGKEIKDIVKSQSSRLEQYLIIQRKWSQGQWFAFFMQKPVIFPYTTSIIWGVFDKKNQLEFCFQCMEDQSLVNAEGDEIDLEDDAVIGMVHPLSLENDAVLYWKTALHEAKIKPIFAQMERKVVEKTPEKANLKSIHDFEGIKIGGYTFVGTMEKRGWTRGSVQDGGSIASYQKPFSEIGITAILIQQGMIGVGYYDDDAEMGTLYFVPYKSVKTGSYCYDEPGNDSDERLIAIENIPDIVYSEVMSDMEILKELEKKEEK